MDIAYLLFLQSWREATHHVLTPFMKGISEFSVSFLVLLPVFLYWCWDKRRGLQTLAALYLSMAVTAVIKLTACVYRPFIKDPRVVPVGKLPSSYSFPSGHTTMGTPIYLGSATVFWQHKYARWLVPLCIAGALITGFSRNYLGVHTPQDVGVGFLVSLACLWAVWKVGDYFTKHPEKENRFLALTAVLCVLAFVYILYKEYPLDYVDGKLLVNPEKVTRDAFEDVGALLAFCGARYIEKTWIRFKATGLNLKGILYGAVGLVGLGFLMAYCAKPFKHLLGPHWGRLAWSATLVFYAVALYPLVLKYFCPPKNAKKR